jgi:phosphoglycerate dehydrogenase-like enzyme
VKALLHFAASPYFRQALDEAGAAAGVETVVVQEGDDAALARELSDTDVVLHILKPFTAAMMDLAPRLKLIQKIGVGVNTIELGAAQHRGIAVCNMPGSNSQAVAEMTLGLMLAVLRRIASLDGGVRLGTGWSLGPGSVDRTGEICGRRVGFVGFGSVPRRLAPALEALGARIRYSARSPHRDRPDDFRPFDDLLAESDILSLHVPLSDETRHLVDRRAFDRLPPGAILINTARGELIDERALVAALASGRLLGAGLDVFDGEPIGPDNPLTTLDSVVLTPHVAWLTPETLQRSLGVAMDNVGRLAGQDPLLHWVV